MSTLPDESPGGDHSGLSRRSLLRMGAWSAPVLALATASPARAASFTDVGAIQLLGVCGQLGILRNGFDLIAEQEPIPVGTTITLVANGLFGLIWDVSQPEDPVLIVDDSTTVITVARAIPPLQSLNMRATFSNGAFIIVNAVVELPDGYTASGAKLNASLDWGGSAVSCDAH